MTSQIEVYAGTAGHSAWFSNDLGETWVHPNSHSGMYLEARVWSYCSHLALATDAVSCRSARAFFYGPFACDCVTA